MLAFLRKYRHLLVGVAILLLALQIPIFWKQDRTLSFASRVLYTIAYFPQQVWVGTADFLRNTANRYVLLVGVEADNERLREENAVLRGELMRLGNVATENERLQRLLAMREQNGFDAVGARIIALDGSAWFSSFTINVGAEDGIAEGMPVATHEGLVGRIVSVAGRSAKVLPVIDLHSAVEVVSLRSRARGIINGRGRGRVFVNYVERSEDLRPDDLLVTSGLGGMYPAGIPVARVTEVRHKSYGLFQEAFAETVVPVHRLENVLVLRYREGDAMPPFQAPVSAPSPVTEPAVPALLLVAEPEPPEIPRRAVPTPAAPRELVGANLPPQTPPPAPTPKPALHAQPAPDSKPAEKPVPAPRPAPSATPPSAAAQPARDPGTPAAATDATRPRPRPRPKPAVSPTPAPTPIDGAATPLPAPAAAPMPSIPSAMPPDTAEPATEASQP